MLLLFIIKGKQYYKIYYYCYFSEYLQVVCERYIVYGYSIFISTSHREGLFPVFSFDVSFSLSVFGSTIFMKSIYKHLH